MGTFNLNSLPKQNRIQMIGEFYDTINSLKDRSEVRLFFKDLLNPNEIAMLMRRLEIAVLLNAGFTYEKIIKLLGVSRIKIATVHKVLSVEGNGYKIAIERLLEDRKKRIKKEENEKTDPLSFKAAKNKYPLHFALFNLIDNLGELKNDPEMRKRAALFTPSYNYLKNSKKRE
ncbi:MAG: YerC/YecD family TrpR-related protein [bacterium]|nr:YerC/YecD family TrpR-related protein [bacterium]